MGAAVASCREEVCIPCLRAERPVGAMALRLRPETSFADLGITLAALIAMPALAFLKRREARRSNNRALAADAVQSATCAYVALITLVGSRSMRRSISHGSIRLPLWRQFPSSSKMSISAWQGHPCGCC